VSFTIFTSITFTMDMLTASQKVKGGMFNLGTHFEHSLFRGSLLRL